MQSHRVRGKEGGRAERTTLPVVTVQPGSPLSPALTTRHGCVKLASKLPSYTRLVPIHGGGGGGGVLVHAAVTATLSIIMQPQLLLVTAAKPTVVEVLVAVKEYEPFIQ